MDGFVTDYISTFTGETCRQLTHGEYAHLMIGCTPEQLPVLKGIARDFGVFDDWFCEVPFQTFMNRVPGGIRNAASWSTLPLPWWSQGSVASE